MKNKSPRPLKRKLFNAYFVSTLSITLVLFLIGVFTFFIFNARYLNNYIRENIGLTLVLNENVREVDLLQLQKLLSIQPEVKTAIYIDSETAAKTLEEELGENFINFLGYNPLHASIDVKLFAPYTNNDSLENIEQKYLKYQFVEEVYYQRNLVHLINKNSNKISAIIIVIGFVMLLIFFALINNTIRLSIYANRFTINTMQLVGATRSFIRRPFVVKSVYQGLIGSLFANFILTFVILSISKQFNDFIKFENNNIIILVFITVFLSGIFISALSTTFAVNKYLRLHYDELFS